MIHYYAARNFLWTIKDFIDNWAPSLSKCITPVAYDAIDFDSRTPPGVHVFTDLERLLPLELALVRHLYSRMAAHPQSYRTLGDPAEWCGRMGLLRALTAAGINDFRAYRLNELGPHVRYPVFLRWEHDHSGSLGAPVGSEQELQALVAKQPLLRRKLFGRYLLAVEFQDVRGDDGLYRKYSAMKIGDRLIARHLLFSKRWITKFPRVVTPETVREEQRYVDEFPHAAQIGEVFRLAGLRYGRVDYGVSNGRIQVWEINTNPALVPAPATIAPERMGLQRLAAASIASALQELASQPIPAEGHRLFGIAERVRWQLQARASRRYNRFRH